ncbi:MAG: ABC transporter permease, partial [Candidatus Aminicenantes bacterium]|nr:ABC transporter permease [Candidatus Aminicenantes bacterium]
MYSNYLKIALRNIKKQKIYSLINISGLAIGTACCILIFLYVSFELSYDKYHNDAERVYRVAQKIYRESTEMVTARISTPVVPAIRNIFPEVEHASRFQTQEWRRNLVERENNKFYESQVMIADNEIFNVLTIPFFSGHQETALIRPNTVVIAQN